MPEYNLIINEAPGKATVNSQPSKADTDDRYDQERKRRQYL